MSVALLIRNHNDAEQRLVPVATQHTFIARWLPGASELGLEWVGLMETGFDVTTENQSAVVDELVRLREWMDDRDEVHELERLDRLVAELRSLRLDDGASAFLG